MTKIDITSAPNSTKNNRKQDEEDDEPDDHAIPQAQKKRGRESNASPKSNQSQQVDHNDESMQDASAAEDYGMRMSKSGKKKSKKQHNLHIQYEHNGHKASSNGSVTVSMRDESIMHMSVNSVTDNNFQVHKGEDAHSCDSNDHFSIKKQMIRYLSRVADRNKPLFVFNQKLNLGGDSSDDDTGTPSFSLVALIEK